MNTKRQVFISYSHKDKKWLEKLNTFLRPLEREAELKIWSDKEIKPSSNWHAEIQKAVNDADAAILLISQDFLDSDYIANNELPQLLSAATGRGLRIYPVIVSSSFLKNSPLLQFQAVNSPSTPLDKLNKAKQNEIFVRLAESIDDLLKVSLAHVTEEWLVKFRSRFVPIQGGTIVIGDNGNSLHALAEHEVIVDDFNMGQYVVTQSEWVALMNTKPWIGKPNVEIGNEFPAVNVNWNEAIDFVRKINSTDYQFTYRLPSEAEWEFAARGGRETSQGPRTKFSFGNNEDDLVAYGWYEVNAALRGENYAHAVGKLRENQLKLFDMHGNIWEWTSDILPDNFRALRGGGFNFGANGAASAFRVPAKPDFTSEAIGFRLISKPRL